MEEFESELATGLSVSIVVEQEVFKVLLQTQSGTKAGLNECLTATFVFLVFDSALTLVLVIFYGNFDS